MIPIKEFKTWITEIQGKDTFIHISKIFVKARIERRDWKIWDIRSALKYLHKNGELSFDNRMNVYPKFIVFQPKKPDGDTRFFKGKDGEMARTEALYKTGKRKGMRFQGKQQNIKDFAKNKPK